MLRIRGGNKIEGSVSARGAKNAVIPLLASLLLSDGLYSISNFPHIDDATHILLMLSSLGVKYSSLSANGEITLNVKYNKNSIIPLELYGKIRAGYLLSIAACIRSGKSIIYAPGGDKIGIRSLNPLFSALEDSGIEVKSDSLGFVIEKTNRKFKKNIFLPQPAVTATEGCILANVIGDTGEEVEIQNAACEPHVQFLCNTLNKRGAIIDGVGSNVLRIKRVNKLTDINNRIVMDPDELYILTFVIYSLITKGSGIKAKVNPSSVIPILTHLKYFNIKYELNDDLLYVPGKQDIYINEEFNVYDNMGFYSQPWPMFPTDLLNPLILIGNLSDSKFIFFEKMYEKRITSSKDLLDFNFKLQVLDEQRVLTLGKSVLKSNITKTCLDVRHGVTLVGAALASNGETLLNDEYHIFRAYHNLIPNLQELGADIDYV